MARTTRRLDPEFLRDFVIGRIGREASLTLLFDHQLSKFEIENCLSYIETYAETARVKCRSPFYSCAVLGLLIQGNLHRRLAKAADDFLPYSADGEERAREFLSRENDVNYAISVHLGDREMLKRYKKLR
ncbi:MAG: hypothetical protein P1U58_20295 [Verrucomicrobiales bacterium]|nr:hypothetical protein [Verrucomicrobiales bacterium]